MGKLTIYRMMLAIAVTAVVGASRAADTVRVGRYFESGFCDRLEDGSIVGVNEDYIRRIADYSGWKVDWVVGSYNQLLQELKDGQIDALAGVSASEERRRCFDFPRFSMGLHRTYLFARSTSPYAEHDFKSWKGVVIGTGPGETANVKLRDYLRENQVQCEIREYETSHAALLGYFRGECQILHSSGLHTLATERIIHTFPPSPMYVAVANSRKDVLEDVENAMDRINVETPGFVEEVNRRHFFVRSANTFYLTETERQYLAQRVAAGGVITVELSPTISPLKKWNGKTGEAEGFVRALTDELERRVGIRFRFLPPADAETVRSRYERGEFDLWAAYDADLSGLPLPYEPVDSILLSRVFISRVSDDCPDRLFERIAVSKSDYQRFRAGRSMAIIKEQIYDCQEDCVKAILNGKADCTMCPIGHAVVLLKELDAADELEIRPVGELNRRAPFRFVFSPQCDPVLVSIVTKALASVNVDDVESCMARSFVGVEFERMSFSFQMSVFLLWLLGLALLVAGIMVFSRSRKVKADLVMRERMIVNRDLLLTGEVKKLMTSAEIISSRAEFIRKPDVKREQALGWTAEILRQSENMLRRFKAFRQDVYGHRKTSRKLRDIHRGGK